MADSSGLLTLGCAFWRRKERIFFSSHPRCSGRNGVTCCREKAHKDAEQPRACRKELRRGGESSSPCWGDCCGVTAPTQPAAAPSFSATVGCEDPSIAAGSPPITSTQPGWKLGSPGRDLPSSPLLGHPDPAAGCVRPLRRTDAWPRCHHHGLHVPGGHPGYISAQSP